MMMKMEEAYKIIDIYADENCMEWPDALNILIALHQINQFLNKPVFCGLLLYFKICDLGGLFELFSCIIKEIMIHKIKDLFAGVMGISLMVIYPLIGLGDLYWLWMAIQLGNFKMFLAGLFPLFFYSYRPCWCVVLIFWCAWLGN